MREGNSRFRAIPESTAMCPDFDDINLISIDLSGWLSIFGTSKGLYLYVIRVVRQPVHQLAVLADGGRVPAGHKVLHYETHERLTRLLWKQHDNRV